MVQTGGQGFVDKSRLEEEEEEGEEGEEGGKGLLEARVDESGAAAPCAPSTHPVRAWP